MLIVRSGNPREKGFIVTLYDLKGGVISIMDGFCRTNLLYW